MTHEPVAPATDPDAPPVASSEIATAAAVAVGLGVPEPRGEVLARVLEGLRGLPVADATSGDDDGDRSGGDAVPLPRRRP